MEADLLRFMAGQQGFQLGLVLRRQGAIQQAGCSFVQQLPASHDDIQRHGNGDQGIENRQSGELHQGETQHHAERGPDIGEQMVGIGPQGDRVETAGRPQQHPGHAGIQGRGHKGQPQADTELLQRFRVLEPTHRCSDDRQGRHHDQHTFDAAGKVFGFEVAVVMAAIRRFAGQGQGPEGTQGRHQIHAGFHRIRQQSHRTGEPPGRCLERDCGHCRGHRQKRVRTR